MGEKMNVLKALVVALILTACGSGAGPLTGPTETQRGEAGAINPARNVYVTCEDKNQNAGVTVTITNNCNKNNQTAEPFLTEE